MWLLIIVQQLPGVVVLVATAIFSGVLWAGRFCACSDTTWTDSDAMNKKGYQARPVYTMDTKDSYKHNLYIYLTLNRISQ